MTLSILETVDRLKKELDALRPLPPDVVAQVEQKLRIESNYHSNAVEGNSLTLGETRSLILHGLTARGKPMRDHLDIQGHDDAVKAIERAVKEEKGISAVFIRNLHRVLLKEPYETEATTSDGRRTTRHIALGDYKTTPNNVRTSTDEVYYFTPPEQVKPEMTDLLDWYRAREAEGEHPVIIAATLHYRFVRIHPFDDGNGRMARLLMNLILIKHGYTVAIVQSDKKTRYLQELERADRSEDLTQFIEYVASCCIYALNLYLRAGRGESVEDPEDIDREIELFKRSVTRNARPEDQVPLKQYAETVVRPYYRYCLTKIESLSSGVFSRMGDPMLEFNGIDTDGAAFSKTITKEFTLSDLSILPNYASSAALGMNFDLLGFRTTSKNITVRVANSISANGCRWKFRVEDDDMFIELEEYSGQHLGDMMRRFDDVVRHLMSKLKRWQASET